MNELNTFLDKVETCPPDQIFMALDHLFQQKVGAIIFTCSVFDRDAQQAMRVHTNQPDAYPVSGLKDVVENRWTLQVLDQGQTFVANDTRGFADIFPDHALINSLGCRSVVNMPVMVSGKAVGTVNLLHEAGYYTPDRVQQVMDLKIAAMVTFLIAANSPVQE